MRGSSGENRPRVLRGGEQRGIEREVQEQRRSEDLKGERERGRKENL